MKDTPTIYLIGPMGAGKSTIGRLLARELGRTFIDTDEEIERRTGTTIPIIFDIEGESGFRLREKKIISELSRQRDLVVATGGGAVLEQENRANLAKGGVVVYLRTSIEKQLRRTRRSQNRPLLDTPDKEARLQELAKERSPLYESIAEITVDSDNGKAVLVTREIIDRLEQGHARTPG